MAGQIWAFALASAVIIVVPGVDMALVTRQVVVHGRRAALATLPGLLTAGLTHALLATVGLSAVLLASATAYTVVKFAGAAWLLALGARTLWASRRSAGEGRRHVARPAPPVRESMGPRRAFLLGLGGNLTNPKMAVFFLTFLPQFVTPGPHVAMRTALLGVLFNVMASTWWVVFVLAVGRLSAWLARPAVRRALERVAGLVLVGLGVRLAVERR